MKKRWLPKEAVRTRAQGFDESPMARVSSVLNTIGCLAVGVLLLVLLVAVVHRWVL